MIFTPFAFMAAPATGGDIVTENLEHYYSMFDSNSYPGSGTTFYDIAGGDNPLDLNTLLVESNIEVTTLGGVQAFRSIGNGAGLISANQNYQEIITSLTLESWYYVESGTEYNTGNGTFVLYRYENNPYYQAYRKSDDKTQTYNLGTTNPGYYTSTNAFSRNQWNHFVTTFDASTNSQYTYINGTLEASTTNNTWTSKTHSSGQLRLLTEGSNFRTTKGGVAIVRVYVNKALTQAEVTQNYDAESSLF